MDKTRGDPPAVKSFADHDVITPPNKFKGVVRRVADDDDPVARAEAALAELSTEFSGWMDDECEQLDKARAAVRQSGMGVQPREALFRAAHDIKGQAATLGFPLVAAVADSLCGLLEHTRDPRRIPVALIDQHVDAVRAIIREHGRPQAAAMAEMLTRRLREVSEDFLRREGDDSTAPDGTRGPPAAPRR
ncbi:MAG TPA: Hpt domain-containing protein [Xanthobacteraceae bacterium]|jgi:chemotaxis protein histidine kinase CheA